MSMHETHSLNACNEDGALSGKCVRRTDRNNTVNGKTPTMYFHKIREAHRNHWCKPMASLRILYLWIHPTFVLNTSRSMKGAEKMRWVLKAAHTLQWGDVRKTWRSLYMKSQIHCSTESPPKISKTRASILVNLFLHSLIAKGSNSSFRAMMSPVFWLKPFSILTRGEKCFSPPTITRSLEHRFLTFQKFVNPIQIIVPCWLLIGHSSAKSIYKQLTPVLFNFIWKIDRIKKSSGLRFPKPS